MVLGFKEDRKQNYDTGRTYTPVSVSHRFLVM